MRYKGIEAGTRRVDFLLENIIMAELKAVAKLEDVHLAQALNYPAAYKLETGLLINFGSKSLEFKRVTNECKLAKQQANETQNRTDTNQPSTSPSQKLSGIL